MVGDEEISKTLETLTIKIDELVNAINEKVKAINEKKVVTEEKIKENPLAYIIGAFIGGLAVGLLIRKKENNSATRNN